VYTQVFRVGIKTGKTNKSQDHDPVTVNVIMVMAESQSTGLWLILCCETGVRWLQLLKRQRASKTYNYDHFPSSSKSFV